MKRVWKSRTTMFGRTDAHHRSRLRSLAGVAWALPCSLVGATFGLLILLAGGSLRRVGPALECALSRRMQRSAFVQTLPFAAITFGHVVLGTSHEELSRLRPHEHVHVRQYERLGIFFLIAYPLASLMAWARRRCPYRDNRFELEAESPTQAIVRHSNSVDIKL